MHWHPYILSMQFAVIRNLATHTNKEDILTNDPLKQAPNLVKSLIDSTLCHRIYGRTKTAELEDRFL